MSAFSDVLHKIVTMLPFHNEELQNAAHEMVDKADEEIKATVQQLVQPSGIKTPDDVQTPQGTDLNPTPES